MKPILKYSLCFILSIFAFFSCTKNDVYDPAASAVTDNPLGFTVSDTFDWNTLQKVTVTVITDGQYTKAYGIKLYDENPVTNQDANILAQGTTTSSSSFMTTVEVGKAQTYVYAQETTPEGAVLVRRAEISGTSATIDFSSVTSRNYSRTSNPVDAVTWASAPTDADFASDKPADAQLITTYAYNNYSGSFFADNSSLSVNAWNGNINIYVIGDDVNWSSYGSGSNTTLYILNGAKVTINSLSLSQNNCKIYISEGGELKVTGSLEVGQSNYVYNRGTIEGGTIKVSSNGVLYNQGTVTATTKLSAENTDSQILNESNITTGDFETAGSGKMYNISGSVKATGTTAISSNGAFWVNNGQWETENYTYTAGSQNVVNNCKLTVDNLMTLTLSDGTGYLLVDGGGEVITKDLYMNVGQVNMLGNAIFKVTGTAEFGYNSTGRGFRGIGDSKALLWMQKAIMKNSGNANAITYAGNLLVACADHFAQGNDGGGTGHYYINYEGDDVEMTSDLDNAGITISANGACSDGYIPKTTPVDNDDPYTIGISHIYAMEDTWPDYGDYDLNDVVVKVNIQAISDQTTTPSSSDKVFKKLVITPTFMATGADNTLGAYLQFDNISASIASGDIESGQEKAVATLTTDVMTLMNGNYVNVGESSTRDTNKYKTGTVSTIELSTAVSRDDIENGLNFFITVNGNDKGRKEIHLSGYSASTLAGKYTGKYFSGENIYKASGTNLVWGICLPGGASYNWPVEKKSIEDTNSYFVSWCASDGSSDTDWYNK